MKLPTLEEQVAAQLGREPYEQIHLKRVRGTVYRVNWMKPDTTGNSLIRSNLMTKSCMARIRTVKQDVLIDVVPG